MLLEANPRPGSLLRYNRRMRPDQQDRNDERLLDVRGIRSRKKDGHRPIGQQELSHRRQGDAPRNTDALTGNAPSRKCARNGRRTSAREMRTCLAIPLAGVLLIGIANQADVARGRTACRQERAPFAGALVFRCPPGRINADFSTPTGVRRSWRSSRRGAARAAKRCRRS